jgi:hypothetical protein
VFRIATALLIFVQLATAASDRDIAEWVLRWEGHVTVAGHAQPISNISQLTDNLQISGIDLTAAVMRPRELVKLEGLKDLHELYLPGPIWNPGGGREDSTAAFKTLATLTSVERLAFGWHFNARIEIRDKEIKQLAGWTKLKDLRCAQCGLANVDLSQFPELENLDLSNNPFTNKGMEGLAGLKRLRRLLLRDALLTDDGLKWLPASQVSKNSISREYESPTKELNTCATLERCAASICSARRPRMPPWMSSPEWSISKS